MIYDLILTFLVKLCIIKLKTISKTVWPMATAAKAQFEAHSRGPSSPSPELQWFFTVLQVKEIFKNVTESGYLV